MKVKKIAVFFNIILIFTVFNTVIYSQQENSIYSVINKGIDYFKAKKGCNLRNENYNSVFIIKLLNIESHKVFLRYSVTQLLDIQNLEKLDFFGYYFYKGDLIVVTQAEDNNTLISNSVNVCGNKDSLYITLNNKSNSFLLVNYFNEGLINSPTIGIIEFEKSYWKGDSRGKLVATLVYPLIKVPICERPINHFSKTEDYIIDSIGKEDWAPWKNCPLKFKKGKIVNGVYKEILKVNFNH